jgi:hypothetical protein
MIYSLLHGRIFLAQVEMKRLMKKTANFCESKKATRGSSFYFFTKIAVFE